MVRGVLSMRNDHLEKVVELYDEHQLHPPISNIYKWHEAKEAYGALVDASGVGKIVIEVGV